MSIEYKNRGILHKLHKGTPLKNILIKSAVKVTLAAETAVLFAKDIAVNRFVGKEVHVKFERKQSSSGKFRTHIKLVRTEVDRSKGLLHKAFAANRFFEGDVPFRKKDKIQYKPKTTKGKIAYNTLKAGKYTFKKTGKAAKGIILASETAVIKVGSAGINALTHKIQNSSETVDGGKAVFAGISSVKSLNSARKYLINYRRKRNQHKQDKLSYKSQKLTVKSAKKNYKSKKEAINADKKQLKQKLKSVKNQTAIKLKKNKAKKNIILKSKIKYQKQLKKSEKRIYKNQKKLKRIYKKDKKRSGIIPVAALPLVPLTAGAKHLASSYKQKLINADPDNDFMRAADKTAQTVKSVKNAKKYIKSKLNSKEANLQKNHLHKKQNTLQQKNKNLKKNKRKQIRKNRKSFKDKAKDAAKKAAKQTQKAAVDFAKFAFKMFGIFLLPIIAIIIGLSIIMLMFTGSAGNSSYILGTYNAQDRYLAWAEEHYTKIAYDFNQKLLKCKSKSEWKNGLNELGVDTSTYDDTPKKFVFGHSKKFHGTPSYDFDPDKLAAFMCAYYYEPDENGNVANWVWNDSYDEVLQKLFDTEYKFMSYYENFSGWKQLNSYKFFGGGGSSSSYYTIYSDEFTKSKMKTRAVPSEILTFCRNGYLYYDYNTLEVLDANNNNKRTGYFIQDQRYIINDPAGHSLKPFYTSTIVKHSEVEKYIYDGTIHYRSYGNKYALLDNKGKETGYFIRNINSEHLEYYKFVWENGTDSKGNKKYEPRSDWYWTSDKTQIYCIVTPDNTEKWNYELKNICLVSFYQKNYWYQDCTLYYTVKKNCTFDEAIKAVLASKNDNTLSRLEFYHTLTQKNKNGRQTYGNHQMLNAPVGGKSLEKLSGKIYNGYCYDIQNWNSEHCNISDCHKGVDFEAKKGEKVYAMCDGYINWINEDEHSLSIQTSDDIEFWYEDDKDNKKSPIEVIYVNLKTNLKTGDTVKQGQVIGTVTKYKHCWHNWLNNKAKKNYLHITLKVGYYRKFPLFGIDWDTVDPLYLIYRNENEGT